MGLQVHMKTAYFFCLRSSGSRNDVGMIGPEVPVAVFDGNLVMTVILQENIGASQCFSLLLQEFSSGVLLKKIHWPSIAVTKIYHTCFPRDVAITPVLHD